jgi:hypothetical protein
MPCGWPSPHGCRSSMVNATQLCQARRSGNLCSTAQQLTEYAGVTHRVTVSVVVEVHEDVLAGCQSSAAGL